MRARRGDLKDGEVSAEELAATLKRITPFSSKLAANNSAQAGQGSASGSQQLAKDWLSQVAARSYSSFANYSMSNLTQGLSVAA